MRKILTGLIGVSLIGVLGMMIAGCGQQTPSISTANSQPSGLAIKGTVYAITLADTRGAPIQGAVVALSGNSATQTTVTNARGEYLFSGVPDGYYVLIVTAEGYERDSTYSDTIKSGVVPADNTITVRDIELYSNPIIVNCTPLPNTVIGQTPTFVVTFDEAMDQSTVLPTLVPNGVRAYGSGNSVTLLTSWADAKTLVITPEAALIANNAYTLDIDPNSTARDLDGFLLDNSGELAQNTAHNYRVTSGGVPSAPANVQVSVGTKTLTNDAATGVDFADVLGGTVGFSWSSSTGAVTGYKVYVANSATGNYSLISSATSTTNYVDVSLANILTALYGTTSLNPTSTGNYPLINLPLYVKVVAYNGDGESTAGSAAAIELVGPRVNTAAYSGRAAGGFAAALLANNYILPALTAGTDTKVAYIAFLEPLDSTTVTAANFTSTAGTVLGATLLTNASVDLDPGAFWASNAYSIVKITVDTNFAAAQTITVGAGVKDLAGNAAAGTGAATVQ
jgi:hypothetical protein